MKTIYHKHHIVPRHSGGTDDPSNIIELTIEQHAEAHRLLWEKNGCPEDYLAYRALSGMLTKQQIIQEACIIGGKKGGPIGGKKGKGRKQTQEWIEKRKLFGEKNGMYQQKHTKHASEKMTKHWQKYFQNGENKKNWIGSKNLRESNDKRFSENNHPSQQWWICEHCKKSGKSMGNYYRHHHDKCKLRNKVIHK